MTRAILVDTSVQIDRLKARYRREQIERILSEYDHTIATGISLLEFKAVVIGECIKIHNVLKQHGRFTVARDVLLEKATRQSRLRAHIFNNLIQVQASGFEIDEAKDLRKAEQARLQLQRIIPRLYRWFMTQSVDYLQHLQIGCNRAQEAPEMKRVAFAVNLPTCIRGMNKTCNVDEFVRKEAALIATQLRSKGADSEQLQKACDLIEEIIATPEKDDLSHGNCRTLGDILIAIEGRGATHAASTNVRDWQPVCDVCSMKFVPVRYKEDKIR